MAYLRQPIRTGLPNIAFRWIACSNKAGLPYALNIQAFTPDVPFCTDPHDNLTVLAGYLKRISCIVPVTEKTTEELKKLKVHVKNFLEKLENKRNIHPLLRVENDLKFFMDWIRNNKNYDQNRKTQLCLALSKCCMESKILDIKDFDCKSFVKREFYEMEKMVRLINSRSDKFKVLVAPFINAIETELYKLKFFVKHNTPLQIAQKCANMNKYPFYLQTDYSAFESCFSLAYVEAVELQLFEFFLKNNTEVLSIIKQCYYHGEKPRVIKLINAEFIAYATECRLSGEMWTSLGNGFANLMNITYLCKKNNIRMTGIVEGDDGLFNLDSALLNADDFLDLGFNIRMEYKTNIKETSFCCLTYNDDTQHLLSAPEQIARIGWTVHARYLKSRRPLLLGLLRAKAMSVYASAPFTPILGPLATKIIELTPNVPDMTFTVYNKWIVDYNLKFVKKQIPMKDRITYETKFGISLSQQLLCEKIIDEAKNLDSIRLPFQFLEQQSINWII